MLEDVGNLMNIMTGMARQDMYDTAGRKAEAELAMAQERMADDRAVKQASTKYLQLLQKGADIDQLPAPGNVYEAKALSGVMSELATTQDGMKRATETAAANSVSLVRNLAETRKMIAERLNAGDQNGAASLLQQASDIAPFGFRLRGYDPNTGAFSTEVADKSGKWIPGAPGGHDGTEGPVTFQSALQMYDQVLAGTRTGPDGTMFNPSVFKGLAAYRMGTADQNRKALADPKNHMLFRNKNGDEVTVIPQLSMDPAEGYNYLVMDGTNGSVVRSMDQLTQSGFVPVDLGKEKTKSEIDENVAQTAAANSMAAYHDRGGKAKEGKDPMSPDELRKNIGTITDERNAILRMYGEVEDPVTDSEGNVTNLGALMNGSKTKAAINKLRDAAAKGDPDARANLTKVDAMNGQIQEGVGAIGALTRTAARGILGMSQTAPAGGNRPAAASKPGQGGGSTPYRLPKDAVQNEDGSIRLPNGVTIRPR